MMPHAPRPIAFDNHVARFDLLMVILMIVNIATFSALGLSVYHAEQLEQAAAHPAVTSQEITE
jgi:hypothetical protein